MNQKAFTKEDFNNFWGPNGYYEAFNYGIGIDRVCEICLYPFLEKHPEPGFHWQTLQQVLEIGCGGGVFTERIMKYPLVYMHGLDVIPKPAKFESYNERFTYFELQNNQYNCQMIANQSIDFAFSYNVFCHLPNYALKEYIADIARVLKPGASFVFMLSDFTKLNSYYPDIFPEPSYGNAEENRMLPNGHFYQDETTIEQIVSFEDWGLISNDMVPEHRDRVVHLIKKQKSVDPSEKNNPASYTDWIKDVIDSCFTEDHLNACISIINSHFTVFKDEQIKDALIALILQKAKEQNIDQSKLNF